MNKKTSMIRLALLALCLLTVLALVACTADTDIGNNTELSHQFMKHVMADDYDAAYDMVKATVTDADFRAYWETIQTAVEGAETYELEQIGWNINTTNGLTTRTTAYQVYTDTDRIILLRTVTREDIAGIAGIHFSDITDFINATNTYIPTVRIVLWVISGLAIAFTVWMFVDCLRRKMKYKVLWAILIFFGIAFTVTVGETSDLSFNIGLFLQTSSIVADPGLVSVVTTLVVPVGGILYLCLRKKFTIDPKEPVGMEDVAAPPEEEFYTTEEVSVDTGSDDHRSDDPEAPQA